MARSRGWFTALVGRSSPLRDPRALALVAALMAGVLVLQGSALLARPTHPAQAIQVDALGQQGTVDRGRLSNAVCAIDLGVDMQHIARVRAATLAEVRRFAEYEGIDRHALLQLVGLGEALLVRYDFARLYYDMALLPPETTTWQLARERERGLAAAELLVSHDQARRFEATVFQAWDSAWYALEGQLESFEDGPRPPPLTELSSTEPTG
jgi:hypothetical protein